MNKRCLALLLASLGATAAMPTTVQAADETVGVAGFEQQIRTARQELVSAIAKKDSAAIAQVYATDATIMSPGTPMAKGHDAIAKEWKQFFADRGVSVKSDLKDLTVSASGDMATEVGTYVESYQTAQGPVQYQGKYVVVWKKEGDAWKVVTEIYNNNGGDRS